MYCVVMIVVASYSEMMCCHLLQSICTNREIFIPALTLLFGDMKVLCWGPNVTGFTLVK